MEVSVVDLLGEKMVMKQGLQEKCEGKEMRSRVVTAVMAG